MNLARLRALFADRAAQRGAVVVEYVLVMLVAAAILYQVEEKIFRPMAKSVLKEYMTFICRAWP